MVPNCIMKFKIIFFLLFNVCVYSQTIKVLSQQDKSPVVNCHIFSNENIIGYTDSLGVFQVGAKSQSLKFTHINYEDLFISTIQNDTTIYLKSVKLDLEEVVVATKKKVKPVEKFLNKIFIGKTNFSFNQHGLVLFQNNNRSIKSLSFEIIDVFGVKNIKYRPFKIGIYEQDESGDIGKKVFESEILEKKDNKKYFNYTLNENFKIGSDFFYVAFEILSSEYYSPNFIQSKVGTIAAVPSLGLINSDKNKSFRVSYDESNQIINFEEIQFGSFNIKIEFDDNR